jgi:hypothetical protein
VRKTIAFCCLLAVFVSLGPMAGDAGPGPAREVTVTIYFGSQAKGTIEKAVAVAPGATVMDAVRKAARVETNAEGTFLVSIEGVANSRERNEFWIYFVNGEAAQVSAASKKLEPPDRVLWFLRKSGAPSHVER